MGVLQTSSTFGFKTHLPACPPVKTPVMGAGRIWEKERKNNLGFGESLYGLGLGFTIGWILDCKNLGYDSYTIYILGV